MDNVQKIENKDTESAIEAILFAAGHPVTYAKLAEVLGYTEATIKKKVTAFAAKYNAVSSRGIMMLTFAYNEPVTRAFIDTVRKVDSAYVVNSLCEKNLIEACGRLDVPGRPNLYRTTPTFLRCFGIDSLEQLPYVDVPRARQEGEIIPLEIPEGNVSEGDAPEGGIPEGEGNGGDGVADKSEVIEIGASKE